jgi:hypothetical protein
VRQEVQGEDYPLKIPPCHVEFGTASSQDGVRMSSGVPINSARRTVSYLAAALVDVDGIVASFSSSTSELVYTPVDASGANDFDGAVVADSGALDLPRSIVVTRTSAANQYSTDPIVVVGRRGGTLVTEAIAQPDDDGNDTLRGTQMFDIIESVTIPVSAGTGGAYTVGVQDIGPPYGDTFTAVKLRAAGQVNVAYAEDGTITDSFAAAADSLEPIAVRRLLTSAALGTPTAVDLTLYLP